MFLFAMNLQDLIPRKKGEMQGKKEGNKGRE
jgi:hypothetical protein